MDCDMAEGWGDWSQRYSFLSGVYMEESKEIRSRQGTRLT